MSTDSRGRKRPQSRPKPRTAPPSATRGKSARPKPSGSKRPRPDRKPSRRRGALSRVLRGLSLFMLLLFIAVGITGCAVYNSMAKGLPDPDITKARGKDQTTVIYDRDKKVLARLYAEENRQIVDLGDMPQQLKQAVIATEDKRFYEHKGVDLFSIGRALVVDIIKGEKAQGGSTITQQYVKQAFVTSEKTLKRKIQEAILAQKVEKRYSKDEILANYLNTIYFGHGAYGVEAASRAYFGKSVKDLNLPESALIAGVLRSPGRYSPYLEPEAAVLRRNTVLDLMEAQGYIGASEADGARASKIKTVGLKAPSTKAPYFVEWVKQQLIEEYGEREVYRGGLRVYTTLDLTAQKAAEKAIKGILDKKGDPSAALVAVKPGTGEVLAMVGGRDFSAQQFNVAVQGRRQPGSAFKPFVLAAALDAGVSPEQAYKSGPMSLKVGDETWKVTGHGGKDSTMRLRPATEDSVNSVFAQLILELGADKVVAMAKELGVDSEVEANPAIALGGLETGVSPLEMANAYATLAAGGTKAEPFGIASIKKVDGTTVKTTKVITSEAIDPAVAYLTTDILKGVISKGTGTAAKIGRPAAGKTGTTQEYRDAWFVGYTPDLAAAVWVGYADSQKEMKAIHGRSVTGGSFPAQIWASFMKRALDDVDEHKFAKPKGLGSIEYCSDTGLTATEFCPKTFKGLYLTTHKPGTCTEHTEPLEVEVPNLVGMPKEDAITALSELKLKAKVVEKVVPGVAAGIVASQDKKPGTKVEVDSVVTLTVASGDATDAAPKASFAPPSNPKAGEPATLDASGSSDDGKIVTYYWEFGDGRTGSGKQVSHAWDTPGTYQITLWVTDDAGQQASVTKTVVVR